MKRRTFVPKQLTNKKGVVAVIVAILLVVFIGFAALAIDVGHLYVVRNELQNAADAAALAGASNLYVVNGSTIEVNTGANQVAFDQAHNNKSENIQVDVNWEPGVNAGDIQRGHWSFATHTFTPNDSTNPPNINQTAAQIDADLNWINAVQVITRRSNTPAASFFARIFGYPSFLMAAHAVAWIGFAATVPPGDIDMPIAICKQALQDASGNYNCHVGRFINSAGGGTGNTGAWTNFTQTLPDGTGDCQQTSANDVKGYVNGTDPIPGATFGASLGTTNGNDAVLISLLYDRWKPGSAWPTQPYHMRLLIIDCEGYPGPVLSCSKIVGVVDLNMIWMNKTPTNKYQNAPRTMFHPEPTEANPDAGHQWTCTSTDDEACWHQFVDEFDLKTADGRPAYSSSDGYMDHTLYFLPSCKVDISTGGTGGQPSNVLAKYAKLVQ